MPHDKAPFWRTKSLEQMTRTEWESLCDGCGRCCLNKLEDVDTGATHFTDVGCKLLDDESCRCKDYARRKAKVPDCVKLTARNVRRIVWLPPTCAYRLVADGLDLYWWHPLVSGDSETVHAAGVSVRGRVKASELDVPDEKLEDYIVSWPGKVPKRAKARETEATRQELARKIAALAGEAPETNGRAAEGDAAPTRGPRIRHP